MSDAPVPVNKRKPGRPPKAKPPESPEPPAVETPSAEADAAPSDAPEQSAEVNLVQVPTIPDYLRDAAIVKLLDDNGYRDAANRLGAAIADPSQKFRDEVRELCRGIPVTFHFSSEEEAIAHQQVVDKMDAGPGRRFVTSRSAEHVNVALKAAPRD